MHPPGFNQAGCYWGAPPSLLTAVSVIYCLLRFPAGSQHERGFLDVSMVDIVAKVKTWTANRPIANLQERIVRRLETWAQAEQAELQQQQEAGEQL